MIEIGREGVYLNSKIVAHGKPVCKIGKNTTFGQFAHGGVDIFMKDESQIIIGDDCMFSWGIETRTTDSNAIFDKTSGEIINKQRPIPFSVEVHGEERYFGNLSSNNSIWDW